MKKKYLVSFFFFVSLMITIPFANTQSVSGDDFEWLIIFNFSPFDKNPDVSFPGYQGSDQPYSGNFSNGLSGSGGCK